MKSVFAAIARVMAAMAATARRWVHRAGRWVLKQIIPASAPMPALPPELSPSAGDADDFTALRRVAGILAQDRDPEPADMRGLADNHLAWLRVLDRRALCRVMAANDATLRGHVKGTAPMKGMPRAERDAVAALLRARERVDYGVEVEEERSLEWSPAL
jgi:hypothetical protein